MIQCVQVTERAPISHWGLACIAMISSYHGPQIDLNTLRRRYPVSLNGVTLRAVIQVASQMQLASRPLRYGRRGIIRGNRDPYAVCRPDTG
ncbi:hypothetical protein IVB16_32485 [Bradyrhizobium sp. 183]|uniref:cysteine peptidase family C39 domain-containing protein n=1 Tax=unclassified Bradyrhizobium TaxID=2631580 RepID=UPI00206B9834|nr:MULTISPECIES: cysteine peptidase family C39 domain-containing protein [unclassified Bradyrhizobium]UPJ79398.1 hypothetical protein IVB17_32480 [Bradyrhizobium sp. 184]UPJ87194.1 hypothetical protein IVB16_32485 [Bradyrhizobium sp. 183]